MAPTYTITNGDVASVAPDSLLAVGVEFDYGNQTITVPDSVSVVSAQWVVDNARFVEATPFGVARPPIVSAYGKYKKGIDPETGFDILAGVEAILLDDWIIATAKVSGAFLVKDVFKVDGSFPVTPPSTTDVQVQYQTAQGVSLATISGGGGSTPAQIWNYSDRSLSSSGVSAIVSGVWNALASGLTAANSIGKKLADYLNSFGVINPSGTVQVIATQNDLAVISADPVTTEVVTTSQSVGVDGQIAVVDIAAEDTSISVHAARSEVDVVVTLASILLFGLVSLATLFQ